MFGFYSPSGRPRPDFFWAAFLVLVIGPQAARAGGGHDTPAAIAVQRSAAAELPRIRLEIGSRTVTAEVALDAASHSRGLMFREKLGRDHGMLFLFPEAQQPCFWMKNTPLPLSIAFIDAGGMIVSLADMQPYSLDTHCAIAPVRYALEMNQGWFARYGAGPGTPVKGLPRLTPR